MDDELLGATDDELLTGVTEEELLDKELLMVATDEELLDDKTGCEELDGVTASLEELSALLDDPVSVATQADSVTEAVPNSTARQCLSTSCFNERFNMSSPRLRNTPAARFI